VTAWITTAGTFGRATAARGYRTGPITDPVMIIADEPTGNLDSRSGQKS